MGGMATSAPLDPLLKVYNNDNIALANRGTSLGQISLISMHFLAKIFAK